MYLLRNELKNSFPYIGAKLGGRDHTTAIHACVKIGKEVRSDKNLLDEINLIKERLYNT
jgi:chromosomal replication initiator protein